MTAPPMTEPDIDEIIARLTNQQRWMLIEAEVGDLRPEEVRDGKDRALRITFGSSRSITNLRREELIEKWGVTPLGVRVRARLLEREGRADG